MAPAPQHAFHRTPAQRLMLHAPNPLVRAVLRSPAHRLLSGRVLLLTYAGRRSGTRYTIPVEYRRDGEDLVITVGRPERKLWWRNLRKPGTPVEVRLHGEDVAMRAQAREAADGVTVLLRYASATTGATRQVPACAPPAHRPFRGPLRRAGRAATGVPRKIDDADCVCQAT